MLVAGNLASRAGQRFGMPSAVGTICVGLVIGPAAFGLVADSQTLETFSQVGVIILMFVAGMETDMEMMRRVSTSAFLVAVGGVVLPFIGGVAVGLAFNLSAQETLFLGAILTATSVSISAQTLKELGLLQSREGTTILAAAVIDDVMGVIVLAFVFSMSGQGDPAISIMKMAIFLPASFGIGYLLTQPVAKRMEDHLSTEAQLSIVISAALAYAWAAERLGGVAAVTGAYMAGLLVARTRLVHTVMEGLNWVAYSFFVPLFFVAIGFKANFHSLADAPALAASLLVVAVCSKIVGCYVAARFTGFSTKAALLIGVGMMSRGEVALVIAAAGLAAGSVGSALFSATILMTLVTTILTPVVLKLLHSSWPAHDEDLAREYEAVGAQAENAIA
ncbi:MAG TPA: cation:proton antiporter [Dehalococcoidia bacterium]|nr:cation:proton antiporter [Dehalococcoidia bacterium]